MSWTLWCNAWAAERVARLHNEGGGGCATGVATARAAKSALHRDQRIVHPPAHPERPRLRLRGAEPPGRVTDTFTSRYVDTGGLRQHAVIGGDGPPLLVHGWPQTWYQWRMVIPALARDFQVIAVDQRGMGLSDKPQDGYDTGTLAGDLVALMGSATSASLWSASTPAC